MSDSYEVTAVMPCLNEELTLGICIRKAQECFHRLGIRGQVVVADNGSSDRSVQIAMELGAKVVHQPVKGYGSALMAGIEAADAEIVIMADADDSYDWSDIGGFVRKVREGYDLVMGNRFRGGIRPGAMPALHRYLGNPVLSFLARIAFRVPIGDFHCGMRAFTRSAYRKMGLRTPGMEFATEMVAAAAHQGLRVAEIPTVLHPDKRDRPPHLRSFRDGWRHLRFILTCAPDHLFLVPGSLLFASGVVLLAFLAAGPVHFFGLPLGIHFVALGSLLALIGFNVLNLGVLAKATIANMYPNLRTGIARWIFDGFQLETGLIVGLVVAAVGASMDMWILARWLSTGLGPLEDTVHLSFVATTMLVIGVNTIFSSFMLNLLVLADGRPRD